jgi:hypothetical protein
VHKFDLAALGEPANIDVLRKLFTDPDALTPRRTAQEIAEDLAVRFAKLADGMRDRDVAAHRESTVGKKARPAFHASNPPMTVGRAFADKKQRVLRKLLTAHRAFRLASWSMEHSVHMFTCRHRIKRTKKDKSNSL